MKVALEAHTGPRFGFPLIGIGLRGVREDRRLLLILTHDQVEYLDRRILNEARVFVERDWAVHVILTAAQDAGLVARVGTVVSSETVVWQAEEKRRLRELTDATGLDMESAAVAGVARERGLPMVIVRTVSDLVDEDLPLDFNLFLRPTGWIKGMQAVIGSPSSIEGLNRLRKQSRVAADGLTAWFQCYAKTDTESLRLPG